MGKVHFRGLDSLRFLAAFFVILDHVPMNQSRAGIPNPHHGVLFFRGSTAVSFFFTLSGFLITYLLLEEHRRTGSIAVKSFYLRRVCRIWPLYFAVVAFGLFFYNALLPRLGIPYPVAYSIPLAAVLYTFFLPNLMNSLYTVGGLLNPLWSIGVEEQFYLSWAPAVKRWIGSLPLLCTLVLASSFAIFFLSVRDVFGAHVGKAFTGQLKFHFMAVGALAAWWLHRNRDSLLRLPVFSSRALQAVLFLFLFDFYCIYLIRWGLVGDEIVQLLLYPWLIVTVAANPRNLVKVANPAFEYLGKISYGLYMLHMIAVYATSGFFRKFSGLNDHLWLYCAAYYGMAVGLTVLLSHLSYRYFESPFLRLKDRRFSLPPAAPQVVPSNAPAGLPL